MTDEEFKAKEAEWRANAANAYDIGVSDGITLAAHHVYPDCPERALLVDIFTKRPPRSENPYADEAEVTMMEEFANLVQENSDLRRQLKERG